MTRLSLIVAALACLATPAAPAAEAAPAAYRVTRSLALGAPARWDYAAVDAARHRLYVTRGDSVQVLDTRSGDPVGVIAETAGVHDVEFAPALGRGFTSNGKSDSLTVFDLDTLKTIRVITGIGGSPDALLFDAAGGKLYSFNGRSKDVAIVDAKTLEITGRIAVSGKPEFAVLDGKGRLFVNIETDPGAMDVIDLAAGKVTAHRALPGCAEPTGLAIDAAHGRLFSVCGNRVMLVTDVDSGAVVARLPIGEHPDAALFDPRSGDVFSSNGDSATLSVYHEESADRYTPVAELPTAKGARTMAMDAASGRIFLPTGAGAAFSVLVVERN